jgi:hypothetical protein
LTPIAKTALHFNIELAPVYVNVGASFFYAFW